MFRQNLTFQAIVGTCKGTHNAQIAHVEWCAFVRPFCAARTCALCDAAALRARCCLCAARTAAARTHAAPHVDDGSVLTLQTVTLRTGTATSNTRWTRYTLTQKSPFIPICKTNSGDTYTSGAVGGKTGKTSVFRGFSKIECGGGSGGAPHCYGDLT